MGQRISRAKKTLSEAHAEFELPVGPERTKRLDDVMAVIYLIFNEGYTATAGEEWMRPDLANEAIRLAGMLAALAPDEPEVLALQALLEIQGSRMPARIDEYGSPVLLEAQDRNLWDQLLIRRGMAALEKAEEWPPGDPGREVLPAGLDRCAACPCGTRRGHRLAPDRGVLRRPVRTAPGPVVEVNREVAHGRAYGPGAGLAVLEQVDASTLSDSPLVPSVRGACLSEPGCTGRRTRSSSRRPRVPRTRANVPSFSVEPTGTSRVGRGMRRRPSNDAEHGGSDRHRDSRKGGVVLDPEPGN